MTETVTIESWSIEFLTKNDFESVVQSRAVLKDEIKDLDKQLKSHNEEIEAMMIAAGVEGNAVCTGNYTVKIVASSNVRIDQQKLLEHGVEPGVIVAATVKKEYTYVKVTAVS